MSESNAAFAEQFVGSNWDTPAPQALQRARTSSKWSEVPIAGTALTELLGSQHSFDYEGAVRLFSLSETMTPVLGPLIERYYRINSLLARQETSESRSQRGLLLNRLQKDYVFEGVRARQIYAHLAPHHLRSAVNKLRPQPQSAA